MHTNLTDGDELLGGLEPPRFQLGGVRYTGRHLSLLQYLHAMQFLDTRVQAMRTANIAVADRATRHLVDLIFPPPEGARRRRSLLDRVLRRPGVASEPSVADLVLALPIVTQEQVIIGFTSSLQAALPGSGSSRETPSEATTNTL